MDEILDILHTEYHLDSAYTNSEGFKKLMSFFCTENNFSEEALLESLRNDEDNLRQRLFSLFSKSEYKWNTIPNLWENFHNIHLKEITKDTNNLNILCLGIGKGELPYSIGANMSDYIKKESLDIRYKIDALDSSPNAIFLGTSGIYHTKQLNNIDINSEYFTREDNKIFINKNIKGKITFNEWNYDLNFRSHKELDIIFINIDSRNFNKIFHQKLYANLHKKLSRNGILFTINPQQNTYPFTKVKEGYGYIKKSLL